MRVSGNHEAADGVKPGQGPVVAFAPRQIASAENARTGAITGTSATQTLSATALLEHRPVSPRPGGRGQAVGDALPGQSLASAAKKQCGRSAGRTGPPSRRR